MRVHVNELLRGGTALIAAEGQTERGETFLSLFSGTKPLFSGEVLSYKQSLTAGSEAELGSVITVYFKSNVDVQDG